MMTLFRGPSQIPLAGPINPPSVQHAGARALKRSDTPASPGPSDTAWRLEQELSVLLSRRPVRRPKTHPLAFYADIEPPEPPARVLPAGPNMDRPGGSERLNTDDQEASDYRARLEPYNTDWLLTARRLRQNHGLRLVASWSITIMVGGFIVSVAAIILFGPPGGKFAFRKNLEVVAERGLDKEVAQTALSETRWRLD